MVSSRSWNVMNLSLIIIILLLILDLSGAALPNVGKAIYFVDGSDHICGVETLGGEFIKIGDLDRCCLEARKQMECFIDYKEIGEGRVNWVCKTSELVPIHRLNNKALHYCQESKIWK